VDRVVALAADHDVVAEAAVHLQADLAGGEAAGVDDIVAAESIDDQLVAGFGMIEYHLRLQAADDDLAADRGDGDDVVAIGGIDGHAVDLLVADCSADDTGQVDVDLRDVGAGEVADNDVVGTAEGVEVDGLDIVQVHDDIGDIAEEQGPPAVGEDVNVLGDVGAVEDEGVDAVLAFDHVVAVAGGPAKHVIAGAEKRDIVAVVAEDGVVAVAAE